MVESIAVSANSSGVNGLSLRTPLAIQRQVAAGTLNEYTSSRSSANSILRYLHDINPQYYL